MSPETTVKTALAEAAARLSGCSESPRLDAEILLSHTLGVPRFDLLVDGGRVLEEADRLRFGEFVERRAKAEPVAYITKSRDFFEDTFYVDERVLVPRPESEFVVETSLRLLQHVEKPSVLDICCGSGCIGLSFLRVHPCELTLADISAEALEVSKINAKRLFPSDPAINFVESDLFAEITGVFDLITANPPYLSAEDLAEFVDGTLEFEPRNALFGGESGFEFTERLINEAKEHLKPGGFLVTELGYCGERFAREKKHELKFVEIINDYAGIGRVAVFVRDQAIEKKAIVIKRETHKSLEEK